MNVFLCRNGSEYFTLICEGEVSDCQEALFPYYNEVRFKESKDFDKKALDGHRKIGNVIIRGCYYSRDMRTLGANDEPCTINIDPRMKVNNGVEKVWKPESK